jgi:glyoxylase-like metal-dependent hydrolase (beta-lactamase superfamily II)
VLTHHHDDHVGGIRPFIEAGATVLAAPETRPVVDSALAGPHTLAGISAADPSPAVRFEPVAGRHVIADSVNEVRIIDVGDNPHASGMLVVHLPRQSILSVADLFEPAGDPFPSPARLPVMRWFVRWLEESGLDPERIYSVHGRALVESWQLDLIRSLADTTSTPS